MSRDWSTAREFGRSMQGVHLLQEATPSETTGDDILFLLNVNEVPADAQPKKVSISGLGAATAPYVTATSGSAVGPEGAIQFKSSGYFSGSSDLIYTGSGVYASGVEAISYTTNLSSINTVTSSGYTLVSTDNGRTVLFTNEAPTVVRVPINLSPGFNCTLIQSTVSGQLTVTPGLGVTVNSAYAATKTTTRYSVAGLIGTASNTYVLTGDITV